MNLTLPVRVLLMKSLSGKVLRSDLHVEHGAFESHHSEINHHSLTEALEVNNCKFH